ncbi:MAG TPA: GDP-mannose 4,6-dehydratase, partial [Candidatus Bilamarchaeaceae archaeon]|nr:GDP-mannose 4,6-dehydratase [Candidatus Bilamarchaeaceae archaeon]
MRTFLVTGGAGFIGSHIADRLLSSGNRVRVLDNFDPYYDVSIKRANVARHLKDGNYELMEGDIRDTGCVAKAVDGVDAIIHEAAQPG